MKAYKCDKCGKMYTVETKTTPRIKLSNGDYDEGEKDVCPKCYNGIRSMFVQGKAKPQFRPYPGYEECVKIDKEYPCNGCTAPQSQCMGHVSGCQNEKDWCIRHGIKA